MAWRDKVGHIWTAADIGGDWDLIDRFRGPLVEVSSPSDPTPLAQRLVDAASDAFDVGTFSFDAVVAAVLRELAAAPASGAGTLLGLADSIEKGEIDDR